MIRMSDILTPAEMGALLADAIADAEECEAQCSIGGYLIDNLEGIRARMRKTTQCMLNKRVFIVDPPIFDERQDRGRNDFWPCLACARSCPIWDAQEEPSLDEERG
jgi:hypothetical protein